MTAEIAGPEATMFTETMPHWVEVTATTRGVEDGTVAGAVYRPLVEIVPIVEFPPGVPLTIHVTGALATPLTVAAYCMVPEMPTVALFGLMAMVGAG